VDGQAAGSLGRGVRLEGRQRSGNSADSHETQGVTARETQGSIARPVIEAFRIHDSLYSERSDDYWQDPF
jgi:hypothetical protein